MYIWTIPPAIIRCWRHKYFVCMHFLKICIYITPFLDLLLRPGSGRFRIIDSCVCMCSHLFRMLWCMHAYILIFYLKHFLLCQSRVRWIHFTYTYVYMFWTVIWVATSFWTIMSVCWLVGWSAGLFVGWLVWLVGWSVVGRSSIIKVRLHFHDHSGGVVFISICSIK